MNHKRRRPPTGDQVSRPFAILPSDKVDMAGKTPRETSGSGSQIPELALILVALVVGIAAFSYSALTQKGFRPEDFGLGLETQVRLGYDGPTLVSLTGNAHEIRELLPQWVKTARGAEAAGKKLVLWLGASQTHAINRRQDGDRLAVEYANDLARGRNSNDFYLLLSSPNANFHDLLSLYLIARKQAKPAWLAIALVYDDLRENPIQKFLLEFVPPITAEEANLGSELAYLEHERVTINDPVQEHTAQRSPTKGTPQEKLENHLIEGISRVLPGYEFRDLLQAKVSSMISTILTRFSIDVSLIKLGNAVQGEQRYPDMPKGIAEWNYRALRDLVRLAREDGIKVLLYKQPIRPTDGTFYHNRQDYDAFHHRVQNDFVDGKAVFYLDLQDIVPQEYWGKTNLGAPDVFHFTVRGHQLLANGVDQFFSRADR